MGKRLGYLIVLAAATLLLAEGGARLMGHRGAAAPFYEPAPAPQGYRVRPDMDRGDQYGA